MSIHATNPYATTDRDRALAQQRQDREDREAGAAAEQQRRDEENAKLRAARLQAIDDRKAAERAERLAADDQAFVADLRRGYLASDPMATEESFVADLPEIRRQARIAAAVNGPNDGELARQRQQAHDAF